MLRIRTSSAESTRSRALRRRAARRHWRPQVEWLERRDLLSTIDWVNRGDDGFDSVFRANAELARRVVDAAIADWQRVITDFNHFSGDTYDLYVSMDDSGANNWGAETWNIDTGFDLDIGVDPNFSPTEAHITLDRGGDVTGASGVPDGFGDGAGYYLDPSFASSSTLGAPSHSSEFTEIINAFAADIPDARPPGWIDYDLDADGLGPADPDGTGDGLYDFYTVVAHEIGHAVGFSPDPRLDFYLTGVLFDDYANDTSIPDASNGNVGTYWTWNSPLFGAIAGALLTDNNGGPQGEEGFIGGIDISPVHTAGPNFPNGSTTTQFTLTGRGEDFTQNFFGFTDLMNAVYAPNTRQLIPNHVVMMLADAYDYGFVLPSHFGSFYAYVDETTGVLNIRGTDTLNDVLTVTITEDLISVTTRYLSDPLTSVFNQFFTSRFDTSAVTAIDIDMGDATNALRLTDVASTLPITINGGSGRDSIHVDQVAFNPNIDIFAGDNDDSLTVEGLGSSARIDYEGQAGNDRITLGDDGDRTASFPGSFPQRVMLGTIDFAGGSGTNTVAVVNAEDFDIDAGRLYHSNDGTLFYSDVSTIQVESARGPQQVRVHGNAPGVELTINEFRELNSSLHEDTGALTVDFNLLGLAGEITVNGVGRDGSITLNDTDFDQSQRKYRFALESSFTTLVTTAPSQPSPNLMFQSFDDFTLNAAPGGSEITVDALLPTTALMINGGSGDDELRLTPLEFVFQPAPAGDGTFGGSFVPVGGDLFALTGAAIDFNAGAGENRLSLDDRRSANFNVFQVGASEVRNNFIILPAGNILVGGDRVTFSGDVDVDILASDFGDTFYVPQLLKDMKVQLFGGGSDDRYEVGFSRTDPTISRDLENNLRAELFLDGGTGSDTLVIEDWAGDGGDYTIFADRLTRKSGLFELMPPIHYEDLDSLDIDTSEVAASEVRIDGFDGDIDIRAHDGDAIKVGAGLPLELSRFSLVLERIHGVIDIQASFPAEISLDVFDQNDTGNDNYELTVGQIVKPQDSGDVTINYPTLRMESVTLNAGAGDNRIDIEGSFTGDTTINGGGGDDRIRITPNAKDPRQLFTPVVFNGQTGVDTLEIFDNADADAAEYSVRGSEIRREETWSLDIGQVDVVKLHGTEGPNIFNADSTNAGVEYELFGRGGDDTFNVGSGSVNFAIQGKIALLGGAGTNDLNIDNREPKFQDVSPLNYDFGIDPTSGRGTFVKFEPDGKFFVTSTPIHFESLSTVVLEGDNRSTEFHVRATLAGTHYTLRGNDGNDDFFIAAGLNSDVTIRGGDPNAAPGDSLQVTGTSTSSAVYVPDSISSSAGVVRVGENTVRFSGLEPVSLENFDAVTMVTPRSHDLIDIAPAANDWTKISGTSGHPALPLPFESLFFRDVRHVTLDTATFDPFSFQFPPTPTGQFFPAFPDDTVTVQPGALDARGLELFDVHAGISFGANIVNDHTLEGTSTAPARLNIDDLAGFTQVNVFGTAPRADVEQDSGLRTLFTAFNSAGQTVHRGGYNNIELLVIVNPMEHLRAIGTDIDRTFDRRTTPTGSFQRIRATDLTTVQVAPTPTNSRLDIVALGDSRVELRHIAFAEPRISGLRNAGPQPEPPVSPDNITVVFTDEIAAGPQPEPPRVPVEGYGAEDSLNFRGGTLGDGTPQPTSFGLDFESLNLWSIELLVRPLEPLAQLAFTVAADAAGSGPSIGFIGNNLVGDAATVDMPTDELARVNPGQFIELLVHDVPTILTRGADLDEVVALETRMDGGIGSSVRQVSSDGLNKIELVLITDVSAQSVTFDGAGGADQLDVRYPEPDFRNLAIHSRDIESLGLSPSAIDPFTLTPVRQSLTPKSGQLNTGGLLVRHDEAVTTSRLDATSIELLVSPDPESRLFSRDLSLSYRYLGSEGKYVVKDVTFGGKFEMTVEHMDGTTNTTTIQEKDVIYEQKSMIKIVGADGGEDKVLVTKAGVETKEGSKLEANLKAGDDLVVVTSSDSGSAGATKDEILITGTGDGSTGEVKTILVHKEQDAAPAEQLSDLALEKPEYGEKIETIKAKADQPLLAEKGTPKPEVGETIVDYKGQATNLELFVKNVSPKTIATSVQNTDGTTVIEKVGSVVITVPELAGTGIDPTQPFATFSVKNTLDAGAGSLRAALDAVNAWTGAGTAVVTFAIPSADAGYADIDAHVPGGDADPDVFVISPLTALPPVTRGNVVVNGQSQQAVTGDSNPLGPEIVLSGNVATNANVVDGLVSRYRFDGSVSDDEGASEPSATAGIGFVDGQVGQGVTLVPGGYIEIPHTQQLAQQIFTLSAWVRPDGPGPNDDFHGSIIIAKGISRALGGNQVVSVELTYSTQLKRFLFGFGDFFRDETRIISALTFEPGAYYHVAGTYDGATFRMYVNGQLQGEKTLVKTINYDPTIPWTIGSSAAAFREVGFPRTWTGVIDEVGIYDRALSVAEIKALATPISGIHLASSGNLVHGLNVAGFSEHGVLIDGNGNTLTGNYIGTSAAGSGESVANGGDGVRIVESSGNQIGGLTNLFRNTISGNDGSGVAVVGGFANAIQGNHIGTTADGTAALGNGLSGVTIVHSAKNLIGGAQGGARNVISGNNTGISIVGALASDNHVAGNYIGVAADGVTDLGNTLRGVFIAGDHFTVPGPAGNVIGGPSIEERNIISGNGINGFGVGNLFLGTMGTVVQGNYIGTDWTGTAQVASDPRDGVGIWMQDDKNSLIAANLVAGNNIGIVIDGRWLAGGTENTRIEGNLIGTDRDGNSMLSSGWGNRYGIYMTGHVDSDGVTHPINNVLIGGASKGSGNVISGNANAGIIAFGPGVQGLRIEGNRVGTDKGGLAALANGTGVYLDNVSGAVVGANEMSGNTGAALALAGGGNHLITGNTIGLGADGASPLGNGAGVNIVNSSGNFIGTNGDGQSDPLEGNVIAFNIGPGVAVADSRSTGNTVRGNSIYSNGGLGIDLGSDGVTPNDELDIDAGPNELQNAPEIRSAVVGSTSRVAGQLRSTPSSTFTIDFYASAAADSSGFGEGDRWLGSIFVTTDALGVAGFSVDVAAVVEGEFLSATATNTAGSTSEFSNALIVRGRPKRGVKSSADAVNASPASLATFDVSSDATQGDALVGTHESTTVTKPARTLTGNPSISRPVRESEADLFDEVMLSEYGYDPDILFADLDEILLSDLMLTQENEWLAQWVPQ